MTVNEFDIDNWESRGLGNRRSAPRRTTAQRIEQIVQNQRGLKLRFETELRAGEAISARRTLKELETKLIAPIEKEQLYYARGLTYECSGDVASALEWYARCVKYELLSAFKRVGYEGVKQPPSQLAIRDMPFSSWP